MTLTQDLTKRRDASRELIPPDKLAVMHRATADLERSGITDSSLKAGDTAPDFVLPNALGASVSLSAMLKKGPVVLSFYRGAW
jgi:hypothetical protein